MQSSQWFQWKQRLGLLRHLTIEEIIRTALVSVPGPLRKWLDYRNIKAASLLVTHLFVTFGRATQHPLRCSAAARLHSLARDRCVSDQ